MTEVNYLKLTEPNDNRVKNTIISTRFQTLKIFTADLGPSMIKLANKR